MTITQGSHWTERDRIEVIAAACHSAWYAYTVLGLGEEGEPWDTAPEWQRKSIRDAVRFWDKEFMAAWDDALPEPDWKALRRFLPAASHENWLKHKREAGWKYGPVKDADKREHPCMVPYADLPEAQKKKDLVVVEVYLAMRAVGL